MEERKSSVESGLNPYCSGIWSRSTSAEKYAVNTDES